MVGLHRAKADQDISTLSFAANPTIVSLLSHLLLLHLPGHCALWTGAWRLARPQAAL